MTKKPDSWPVGRPEHLPEIEVVSTHVALIKSMNDGWDEPELKVKVECKEQTFGFAYPGQRKSKGIVY
jgi:hypothetical protein